MTSVLVGVIRLVAALTIVVAMIATGWCHRSPWIVLLATPAFTMLYALGKWTAWRTAWRLGGVKQIIFATLTTLPVQAVLAGVLYLLGLGLGRLVGGYRPIAELSAADVVAAGALFAVGVVLGAIIIRVEGVAVIAPPALAVTEKASTEDLELDVDPTPLTLDTFFTSPGYWRVNAARQAVEGRGAVVEKPPLAAREDMIVAAEERLRVRLPETLRALYGVMNGGYVDWLYVALTPEPRPVFADWRGAFAIDYSSLAPLEELRTVAEHYDDFTDDPDEIPADADRLVILQARYGDMTLLDYSRGPEPRVLLVDYDKMTGEDPIDLAFDDFDAFFAALRRDRDRSRPEPARRPNLGSPLGEAPRETWARRFWGEAPPHPFHANATHEADGSEPQLLADDDLVAATHARLAVTLPASLIALWRNKNGGGVASRFVEITADGIRDLEVMRLPVPLEHVVDLAALSDRIAFPPGEIPWKQRHADADRLIVLEADHDRALLLDYRDRPDGDPAVLVVEDLGQPLTHATRFENWDEMLVHLRFQRSSWDTVAKPHEADVSEPPS